MADQVNVDVNGQQRAAMLVSGGTSGIATSTAPLPSGTDRGGTIATGGTAQQMAPANASRKFLVGQNTSAGDLWINETGGTAAVDGAGSYQVASKQPFSISTARAISIIGATTGQRWAATEG